MSDETLGPPSETPGGIAPGQTPEPGATPPDSPPPARRSRAGALLLGFALVAILGGGAWFLAHLEPREQAMAEPETPVDTVQILKPPATKPAAEITSADLPGFETEGLTPGQLRWLYHKARLEECGCGCGMNVAQCRIEDPNCPKSPARSVAMVEEARKQKL